MPLDWKDALSALKDSGTLPVDNTPDPEENLSSDESYKSSPLNIVIDKKGRKGKTATIIEGFTGPDNELENLAKILKQKLGTGGSARGGEILIQGDRKEEIKKILKVLGYRC